MQNIEISAALSEMGVLLEIQGANPFRIRAYRNAVHTIDGLTRTLSSMVEADEDLTELPGIGKDLAGAIRELIETGSIEALEALREEVPEGLIDVVKLDGVGPKKANKLWKELDVTGIESLEKALQSGEVEALSGFGKKSAEKMVSAIESLRRHSGRILLATAEEMIAPLIEYLAAHDAVETLEVAGSFRRRKDTIGDIDLLVAASDGASVMEHFTSYPGADRVEASGETKGRIVLRLGLRVDLRVVPGEIFGAALYHFTGSKEHNVALRGRGVRMGLRVSEWGVFRVRDDDPDDPREGDRIAGRTEEEVAEALGIAWIPPVLRENRGEIEAAEEGSLPDLLDLSDLRGDLHMHTTWTDGAESIETMARACAERGYAYMAVTDHSQAVTVAGGLTPDRVREQMEAIAEAREAVGDEIHIFHGCEVDILRGGELDLPDDVLEALDIVLVSVHSLMDMPEKEMTERVVRAVEHPSVDVLCHPTGRLLGRRDPFAIDMEAVLDAAKRCDVAVEINASPRRLDLNDVHALRAREMEVRVAINTDAHAIPNLDYMRFGVDQARRGWLEKEHILNTLSLREIRAWLDRDRA